jgi:uncharacterized iron-regulated protein
MLNTNFSNSELIFFQEQYKCIDSNITNLEEAEVICLGETHDKETDERKNAWLIDLLYKPGDVILVEGLDKDEEKVSYREVSYLASQARFVKKTVKIKGWDSQEAHNKIDDVKGKAYEIFALLKAMYQSKQYNLPTITKILEKLEESEEKQKIYELLEICQGNEQRVRFAIYAMVANVNLYCGKLIATKVRETFVKRNECMKQAIQMQLNGKNKVFVIAGKRHFSPNKKTEGHERIEQEKELESLRMFLKEKKFVIFNPTKASFRKISQKQKGLLQLVKKVVQNIFKFLKELFSYKRMRRNQFRNNHPFSAIQFYELGEIYNNLVEEIKKDTRDFPKPDSN